MGETILSCAVCTADGAKYKCPLCQSPYCSIICYRTHKETHAGDVSTASAMENFQDASSSHPPVVAQHQHPQSSAVTPPLSHPYFSVLESSPELQLLFTKYPPLRAQLLKIYIAMLEPQPAAPAPQQQRGRGYHQGRGRGRGHHIGPGRQPWTPEKRIKEGLYALTKAEELPDGQGEGVEEFKLLVLKLCAGDNEPREAVGGMGEVMTDAEVVAAFLDNLR